MVVDAEDYRWSGYGAAMGSREFVEGMSRERREWFGERRMRGLAGGELFTVRDLRVDVFG